MSATDELRRLLDERGVEYVEDHGYREFFWNFGEYGKARVSGIDTRGLVQIIVTGITPEQAVEATLGRGTCRVVRKPVSYSDDWKESLEAAGVVEVYTPTCSECGAYIEPPSEFTAGWNYCPNCGRRIEVDA